jgi:hypothetical protein
MLVLNLGGRLETARICHIARRCCELAAYGAGAIERADAPRRRVDGIC